MGLLKLCTICMFILVLVHRSSSIFTGPRQMDFSKDESDTCNFSDLKLPDLSVSNLFIHLFMFLCLCNAKVKMAFLIGGKLV